MGNNSNKHFKSKFTIKLIEKRYTWSLTAMGWLVTICLLGLMVLTPLLSVNNFLSLHRPLPNADILVVEGWLSDQSLLKAIEEFEEGEYQLLVTTGASLERGFYLSEYKTFAQLTEATLLKLGFPANQLVAVPTKYVMKNRTMATALSVRKWLLTQNNLSVKSMNILSWGPHARRSWLIFQKVMQPEFQVGIIAIPPTSYEPARWWQSSEGFRVTVGEFIAYIYAKFINWQS
ncbi:MAG: YdcF family protein [Microcoleaceae cyanobacterium]